MKWVILWWRRFLRLKPPYKAELALFMVLILVAAFFRFYRLEEFITFLGDQGRDAIVIKRILTGEDFPGIGPRSSVGQLFLGPFYYYLMAPFLFLFQFNPVGLAAGVAFISIIGLAAAYWIVRKEANLAAAILFTILVSFSSANIWLSRFSWNPNLLPVFAFLTFYFCSTMFKKKNLLFSFLFGAFFAASIQLHYLMLLTIPAMGIILIWQIIPVYKHLGSVIKKIIAAGAGFGIVLAPLILFDIKNRFLNLQGIIGLFTDKRLQSSTSYMDRLTAAATQFLHHILQITVPTWTGTLLLALLIAALGWLLIKKKSPFLIINALSLLIFLGMFAIIDADRILHYYTPAYYSLFVLIAYFVSLIRPLFLRIGAVILIALIYCWLNLPHYPFWQKEGNFQTHIANSIAQTVLDAGTREPYYLVSIPLFNTNDHIRYYLETKGKRPLPEDTREMAQDLIILCYDKSPKGCDVMNDGQYLVVHFGDRKIAKIVHHKEVTIYRLIHAK